MERVLLPMSPVDFAREARALSVRVERDERGEFFIARTPDVEARVFPDPDCPRDPRTVSSRLLEK